MTTTDNGIYRPPMHPDPNQRGITPPPASGIVVNTSETTAELDRALEIRNRYTEKDVQILPLTSAGEPNCCEPPEFRAWPKTPRLFRDMVVTEKIDGTNACIIVQNGEVHAQSRSRIISVEKDNFGLAKWVHEHYTELQETLGEGYHYGEWWGSGIQRGYGLTGGEKRFSLFNVKRWENEDLSSVPGLGVVPVLKKYTFDTKIVDACLEGLRSWGSQAAPGFMQPEGVVVYHTASGQIFKALLENDHEPKGKGGLTS